MSGHSKWATIHRQKETKDAQRGQVFTKLANAITIAVRSGGGVTDPEKNFKLRLAIEKARTFNMPKDNIERAIGRGAGGAGGANWEEAIYEGYGPGGAAVIVETVTDNKNRTSAEIKNLFDREGGHLSGPGAVSFQFQNAGLLTVKKGPKADEQMLAIMDLGVEDIVEEGDILEVYVDPEQTASLKEKLTQAGFEVTDAEVIMRPKVITEIKDKKEAEKVLRFMEALESHSEVHRVFSNFDIPDEILKSVQNS